MENFRKDLGQIFEAVGVAETLHFPFNESESLRATSIDVLDLNVRSTNGLRRKGINTIGSLIDNWGDLKTLRGLGITSVNSIKVNFYEYYYSTLSDEAITKFWSRFLKLNYDITI